MGPKGCLSLHSFSLCMQEVCSAALSSFLCFYSIVTKNASDYNSLPYRLTTGDVVVSRPENPAYLIIIFLMVDLKLGNWLGRERGEMT